LKSHGRRGGQGKLFDIILMIFISVSVIVLFLDSFVSVHESHGKLLYIAEWFFTIVFTIEYILRIIPVRQLLKYLFPFYGIIDALAFLPTYLSLFITGGQFLIVIRLLRLLRIFRVLKLGRFLRASSVMLIAVRNSRYYYPDASYCKVCGKPL
jgi:voltage-gated potassium channel